MLRSLTVLALLSVPLSGTDAWARKPVEAAVAAFHSASPRRLPAPAHLGERIDDQIEHCEAPAQGGLARSSWLCVAPELLAPGADFELGLPDLPAISTAVLRLDPLDDARALGEVALRPAPRRAASEEPRGPLDGQ